jgi:signal peptidase I
MESEAAADQPPAEPAAEPAAKKEGWWDTIRFLLIVFAFAIVIRTFIAAPFSIPSGSMLPRLMIGDYLFVAKWPYGYSRFSFPFGIMGYDGRMLGGLPERGDVVVFRHPGADNEDWVKRVIGLPGDTVQVRSGQVFLNGRPLPRTRIADYLVPVSPNSPCRRVGPLTREGAGGDGQRLCAYARFRETLPGGRSYDVIDQDPAGDLDDTALFRVPEGQLFVMGDNRDDSQDSRVPVQLGGVGMLPVDNVLGRALVTFFSTDGAAQWLLPWTWLGAARWDRIGGTS